MNKSSTMWSSVLVVLLAVIATISGYKFSMSHQRRSAFESDRDSHRRTASESLSSTTIPKRPIDSRKVDTITGPSWTGIAESPKAGPYLIGPNVFVDLPSWRWPDEAEGKRVTVSGHLVVRHDLPVFEVSDKPLPPGVGVRAGIPVPKGTDLYKASERSVIEDAHWAFAPEKK